VRIAIHTDSAHEHPHLHHHILWAVFAMIVFMFLFARAVAGEPRLRDGNRSDLSGGRLRAGLSVVSRV